MSNPAPPSRTSPSAAPDPWAWMDFGSAQAQSWLELQQALWQPWWDAQAQWLRFWQDSLPLSLTALRGAEQLG